MKPRPLAARARPVSRRRSSPPTPRPPHRRGYRSSSGRGRGRQAHGAGYGERGSLNTCKEREEERGGERRRGIEREGEKERDARRCGQSRGDMWRCVEIGQSRGDAWRCVEMRGDAWRWLTWPSPRAHMRWTPSPKGAKHRERGMTCPPSASWWTSARVGRERSRIERSVQRPHAAIGGMVRPASAAGWTSSSVCMSVAPSGAGAACDEQMARQATSCGMVTLASTTQSPPEASSKKSCGQEEDERVREGHGRRERVRKEGDVGRSPGGREGGWVREGHGRREMRGDMPPACRRSRGGRGPSQWRPLRSRCR